jgi:peroxiredoxin Q/BCP
MDKQNAEAKSRRSVARSRLARNGLPSGSPAPMFCLPRVGGGTLGLRDYKGRRLLLVFVDPGCSPCSELIPYLEELHRHPQAPPILLISRGSLEDNERTINELHLTIPIVLQRHWEVSRDYAMFATPMAYALDRQGLLVEPVAIGGSAVLDMAWRVALLENIEKRLEALRGELEAGQSELDRIQRRRRYLREATLRISGAIHVLQELMEATNYEDSTGGQAVPASDVSENTVINGEAAERANPSREVSNTAGT